MPHLLTILAALLICAAPLHAQTMKSLMFNSTNGQVVANTGTNVLTFTNDVGFGNGDLTISGKQISSSTISFSFDDGNLVGNLYIDGAIFFGNATNSSETRANLGFSTNLNTLWTATNASNARSAVGLGATWLTNTNVTNFRTAIGLGATNEVEFAHIDTTTFEIRGSNGIVFDLPIAANNTRTNLGLPLSALTNTSNVTAMRALAGSTNTNHPYSGSISVVGTNNTNTLVFSNGILQSVQ